MKNSRQLGAAAAGGECKESRGAGGHRMVREAEDTDTGGEEDVERGDDERDTVLRVVGAPLELAELELLLADVAPELRAGAWGVIE